MSDSSQDVPRVESHPNVLLITTDQQRFDTIQAAGNRSIFTPHLDWLCDSGIRFSRCYTDAPVCIPARATMMTGRHGYTNGLTVNATDPVPMAHHPTLPGVLTQAGYQTRAIGKMHFHPSRGHYGFEHMQLLGDYVRDMERFSHAVQPKNHGVGENEMVPVLSPVEEAYSQTHWLVDRAVDFMDTRDPLRPFFLWLSFPKPHPPYDCDPKYWMLYDGVDLPEPVRGDWSQRFEDIPLGLSYRTIELNNIYRLSPAQLRAVRRAYYACITQIDYNLGMLFARMRELGYLANTWIVFTADHGEMLGDHGLGAKSVFLEPSWHVPLVVRPPAVDFHANPLGGTVRDDLACQADLMPTILDLADVAVPDNTHLDGRALLNEATSPRRELFGSCGDRYVVVRDHLVYSYGSAGGFEFLFDLAKDPYEQHDLIRAGTHQTELRDLREALTRHVAAHHPEAVRDGKLVDLGEPKGPFPRWPGLHTRYGDHTEVLH